MKKIITLILTCLLSYTLQSEVLGTAFTYQGELKDFNGNLHDGEFDFNFKIYSDEAGNNQLGSAYSVQDVMVTQGIFSTQLDFGDTYFMGDKVWLEINIRNGISNGGYTQLLPLQQITPSPYAIQAKYVSVNSVSGDEIINGSIITADMADASINSDKIVNNSIATVDYQDNSITSAKIQAPLSLSTAIVGSTNNPPEDTATIAGINTISFSDDNNMFGVYGKSGGGYNNTPTTPISYPAGVYGHGEHLAYGVKGTAGDVSGLTHYLGSIGVVGFGENRGVVGASDTGNGLYGSSRAFYGLWGKSTEYRGVTGRTSRADDNYGLYTPDNLFAKNYTLKGAISKIFKYSGKSELKIGDVVSFSGITQGEKTTDAPVVLVKNIQDNPNASVAGVVLSRFDIDAVSDDETVENRNKNLNPTPSGAVQPGEYLLVVIEGPAKINLDMNKNQLSTGSLLVIESSSGQVKNISNNSINTAGHIVGTYLGTMATNKSKNNAAFVYVSTK